MSAVQDRYSLEAANHVFTRENLFVRLGPNSNALQFTPDYDDFFKESAEYQNTYYPKEIAMIWQGAEGVDMSSWYESNEQSGLFATARSDHDVEKFIIDAFEYAFHRRDL